MYDVNPHPPEAPAPPGADPPSSRDVMRRALAQLGPSAACVALTMRALGLKGVRGSAADCPLSRHLRERLEYHGREVVRVEVYGATVAAEITGRYGPVTSMAPLTQEARDFVAQFNAGRFPDLIETQEAAP